jgi:hypothetical protein
LRPERRRLMAAVRGRPPIPLPRRLQDRGSNPDPATQLRDGLLGRGIGGL